MAATLRLHAPNAVTEHRYRQAAARRGMTVESISADPVAFPARTDEDVAIRAPTGLVAEAIRRGRQVWLSGPTPAWFAGLGPHLTGRDWRLTDVAGAARMLGHHATFIKLADGKHRGFPARRFTAAGQLHEAVAAVGGSPDVALLAAHEWLDIHSEYRVFTRGRTALTVSAYQIEGEIWSPGLNNHRGSVHDKACEFVGEALRDLPVVPPAAVLDVGRLDSGRLILLEANQAWAAGLYSCDADLALDAVIAGSEHAATEHQAKKHAGNEHVGNEQATDGWLWRPDLAVRPYAR